jgi:hypothetical protein
MPLSSTITAIARQRFSATCFLCRRDLPSIAAGHNVRLGSRTVLQLRSVAGPLHQQIAVAVAATPKMLALCHFLP